MGDVPHLDGRSSRSAAYRPHHGRPGESLAPPSRSQEIATLRALGFQGGPVLISVMAESLVLAIVGGVLGGGAAYLVADGYNTATINFQSFSQVAFSLSVTPRLLLGGIAYALAMGFFGGIFPAVRAIRIPIAIGLREP